MDIKIVFAILGTVVSLYSYFPYIKDTFRGKTHPHAYTWFIWAITQGTAAAGVWYGGGRWGTLELTAGVLLILFIFILSFRYGTSNITKSDTIVLVAALAAIFIWWKLNSPFLAVLMVSLIDLLGYIPSFRKSFYEPWSETVHSWIGFTIGNFFAMLALKEYNWLTLTYLVTINAANIILILICLLRRPSIPKPIRI